jgi:copper chaperone CopZ
MKRNVSLALLRLAWIAALTLIATPVTRAQPNGLVEVEQVIFGMDCAPCAYGIERSLKKLPGVEQVHVSLNEGKASLRFKPGAEVTLQDIRNRIVDGGFTPKSAKIRAVGTVAVQGEQIHLSSGPRATFILRADTSDSNVLRDVQSGSSVEITGVVREKPGDPPALIVDSLKLAERSTSDR